MGLTVPTEQKPQGFHTSGGTSMGYGERHDPLDGIADPRFACRGPAVPGEPKRPANINPGVGAYDVGKGAEENHAPTWK